MYLSIFKIFSSLKLGREIALNRKTKLLQLKSLDEDVYYIFLPFSCDRTWNSCPKLVKTQHIIYLHLAAIWLHDSCLTLMFIILQCF